MKLDQNLDIENKRDLSKYLNQQGWIATEEQMDFEVLRGGVSNKAVYVSFGSNRMVIKQALEKLRTEAEWFSDPERLQIEAEGLMWMGKQLPDGAVPKHIFFDNDRFILGMEGISQPHDNLKELLLNGILDFSLAKKLGHMLGTIHHRGASDQEAQQLFEERAYFIDLRIEPYYEHSARELPESGSFFEKLIEDTLKNRITIVHGDFSPKNILVKGDRLILLDFEVTHFGDPAFDVGFLLSHFLSKANYLRNIKFVDAAREIWNAYRTYFEYGGLDFEERCIRHTIGCMIARIYGRSPLEYLTQEHRDWQSGSILGLIKKGHQKMSKFLGDYKTALNASNH